MFTYFFVTFVLYQVVFGNPISNSQIVIENATQLESPWLTLLSIYDLPCGGALVQDQFIVTAAHCFDTLKSDDFDEEERMKKAVKIKLGEWKTETDPDCSEDVDGEVCDNVIEIPIKSLVQHEDYKKFTGMNKYKNDIAIIKLAWPPRMTQLISSIDLPDADDCKATVEDEVWTVTGFGQTPAKVYTTIKKKIDMRIISHEECEHDIADSQKYYDKKTHICGKGTKGETTCKGDSGSALVSKTDDGAILQGIVSFGVSECGTRRAPSGFVKVACFVEWIEAKIAELKENQDEEEKDKNSNEEKSNEETKFDEDEDDNDEN